ncbi:MAG TPA: phosphate/phosphite/phosphonate ABC transporter substrate-binding protein [Candidatus Methanoperedens sp.]|nr:phosphate/phosphite/phosphonate ABC transporter substrate-binding protein [Candidatus Methanoperedens sp.]
MRREARRHGRALGVGCLLVAVLAACGRDPAQQAASEPAGTSGAPPITIALLPERNVFEQKKRYQPLQEYLSSACTCTVTFKLLDNYQLIFSEILERRVDGAFFGSMNGAIAQLKGAVEVLARPVDLKGISTYKGYIFTRNGSGATIDPRTWKGRNIALVNRVTTAGYLYPLALLRRSGLRGDPAAFFRGMSFTGSHDAAMLAVFNGEADLGACKDTVYEEQERVHPELARALTVLGESAAVPSNGLGVRPELDATVKAKLRESLLRMHEREDGQRALRQFGAQRFIETNLRDYEPVLTMAREAGVDLAAWPLRETR